MNSMPNTFYSKQDVIWMMLFGWYHSAVKAVIDSCYGYNIDLKVPNFLLLTKKQSPTNGTTYLVKNFSLFVIFPSTKFWSNYIAWLYIKRTKLHTKGDQSILLTPSYAETSLILLQSTHFHTSTSLLQSPSS